MRHFSMNTFFIPCDWHLHLILLNAVTISISYSSLPRLSICDIWMTSSWESREIFNSSILVSIDFTSFMSIGRSVLRTRSGRIPRRDHSTSIWWKHGQDHVEGGACRRAAGNRPICASISYKLITLCLNLTVYLVHPLCILIDWTARCSRNHDIHY
jgi:hypothetical protein